MVDFSPCAYKISECEVAVKCYEKGASEGLDKNLMGQNLVEGGGEFKEKFDENSKNLSNFINKKTRNYCHTLSKGSV